jgi:sec-independent protein translocase protein TatB
MFGLGMGEILLIAALVRVVVGPDKLPEMMRTGGKWYAQLRRAADDLRRAFVLEADRMDAEERLKNLEQRRKDAMEARRKAQEAGGVAQAPKLPPTPADPPAPAADAPAEPGPEAH